MTGAEIRAKREAAGISLEVMADAFEMTPEQWAAIERGPAPVPAVVLLLWDITVQWIGRGGRAQKGSRKRH